MSQQKNRIPEMDVTRALATVAVVLIHISATPLLESLRDGATTFVYLLVNVGARFAVPTFVLLSGMGLATSGRRPEGYLSFLKRRLTKVIGPYLLWSIIYSFAWNENTGAIGFARPSLSKVLLDLVTGGACYHLYFILIIVQLYILFPLIRRTISSNIGLVVTGIIAVIMLCIGRYADIPERWEWFFDLRNPLHWLFYFGLGIRLVSGKGIERLRSRRFIALLSAALLIVLGGMMLMVYLIARARGSVDDGLEALGPIIIPYTLLANAWLWKLRWPGGRVRSLIQVISDRSYMIYLSHALMLIIYMTLWDKLGWQHYGFDFGIGAVAMVAAGCLVFALIGDGAGLLKRRIFG